MRHSYRAGVAAVAVTIGAPALAQARPYCAVYAMTGCTMAKGRVAVEGAAIDWERNDDRGVHTDNIQAARFAIRAGVSDRAELIAGWTPYVRARVRDAAGRVATRERTGDVFAGAKLNLARAAGEGFGMALLPFVRMPTDGRKAMAGVGLPMNYDVGRVSLRFVPQVDATPDLDGVGRHPVFTLLGGTRLGVRPNLGVVGNLWLQRNDDPRGRRTLHFATAALPWKPNPDFQIEPAATIGLDRRSPDLRLVLVLMRRL